MGLRLAGCILLGGITTILLILSAGLGCASADTAGQFHAYFAEVTSPEQGEFSYLACYSVMLTLPQVWLVDLAGGESAQPVPYAPFVSACQDSVWQAWTTLTRLEGKRMELRGLDDFDLELRLKADSVGVDPLCGVTAYRGNLVVEAARGSGVIDLDIFCDTLIQVRGVYQLPGRSERVVFISYKGEACGCREVDIPIVIHVK
jgi:hypothetical protein